MLLVLACVHACIMQPRMRRVAQTHLGPEPVHAQRDDHHLLRLPVDDLLRLVTKHLDHHGRQAQAGLGAEARIYVADAA